MIYAVLICGRFGSCEIHRIFTDVELAYREAQKMPGSEVVCWEIHRPGLLSEAMAKDEEAG